MTSTTVDLRGTGILAAGETLYLPICGLRVWEEPELDAVIGHELGHFRGEDLRYSERLAPALQSLAVSLESAKGDSEARSGWFGLARVPAVLVLTGMMAAFRMLIGTAARERELVADQAALSVSTPAAPIGAIIKLTALGAEWLEFQQALACFVTMGHTRENFCEDYLERVSMLCQRVDPDRLAPLLLASQQSHPFDSHPPLGERAAALGVGAVPIVRASIEALRSRVEPDPVQAALEREVTDMIAESIRLPGRELRVDPTLGLPSGLARR